MVQSVLAHAAVDSYSTAVRNTKELLVMIFKAEKDLGVLFLEEKTNAYTYLGEMYVAMEDTDMAVLAFRTAMQHANSMRRFLTPP